MRTLMMIGLAVGLLSLPLSASAAVHKSSARVGKRAHHARMVKHAKAKSKRSRAQHASNSAKPAKAHRV
jgi:hypothetical protein